MWATARKGNFILRLQLEPYLPGKQSSHEVPLKPLLQRHSPVPLYPSSQEPWLLHGVSGPPGQAERFKKKKKKWLFSSSVCLFIVTVIYCFVKILELGKACKCIFVGACKSTCDTCKLHAPNSLKHFYNSCQKSVVDAPSPGSGCCCLGACSFRSISEWHCPDPAQIQPCLCTSMWSLCCWGEHKRQLGWTKFLGIPMCF